MNCRELSLIINWNLRNTWKPYAKKLHLNSKKFISALRRIQKFLTVEKATKFNYAPLIWIFVRKTAFNKILKISYRTLQVVYSEYHKSYEELLQINKDISIHQKHLRILALEVYQSILHSTQEFMWHCFNTNPIPDNSRKRSRLLIPHAKAVNFGTNSITLKE